VFESTKIANCFEKWILILIFVQTLNNHDMAKYVCDLCGWEYDPEAGYPDGGIAPGTAWENVPADFECPLCGASKDEFSEA
jgi:rubredoxin-NAD+ reductase